VRDASTNGRGRGAGPPQTSAEAGVGQPLRSGKQGNWIRGTGNFSRRTGNFLRENKGFSPFLRAAPIDQAPQRAWGRRRGSVGWGSVERGV